MRQWKDDLVPVLLEMMQDSTAVVKREVYSSQTTMPFCLITFLCFNGDDLICQNVKCKSDYSDQNDESRHGHCTNERVIYVLFKLPVIFFIYFVVFFT